MFLNRIASDKTHWDSHVFFYQIFILVVCKKTFAFLAPCDPNHGPFCSISIVFRTKAGVTLLQNPRTVSWRITAILLWTAIVAWRSNGTVPPPAGSNRRAGGCLRQSFRVFWQQVSETRTAVPNTFREADPSCLYASLSTWESSARLLVVPSTHLKQTGPPKAEGQPFSGSLFHTWT